MSSTRARAVLVCALALGGALGAVLGQGRVMLHGCVDAAWWTPLGLRCSVLTVASSCPQGGYGMGAASRGAVLVLSVAVPVLVAHLALAACGVATSAALAAVLRVAARLWRGLWRRVPRAGTALPTVDLRPVRGCSRVPAGRGHPRLRSVRGPPLTV